MTQFTMSIMVKHLLNIKPGEPRALEILEDFETYMKGFVSLPIYIPGTAYSKAIKVKLKIKNHQIMFKFAIHLYYVCI